MLLNFFRKNQDIQIIFKIIDLKNVESGKILDFLIYQ